MKKILVLVFGLTLINIVNGQVTGEDAPVSWSEELEVQNIPTVQLPKVNVEKLKAEDLINDKQAKPWRFGFKHDVNYGFGDGIWTVLANGDRIWRIKVASKNALSLNFIFDQFYMPEGASVYLYSENHKKVLGAYTSVQNQESGVLGTWLIDSDNVIVEYFEPANVYGLGKLHIGNVTHGYRNAKSYKQEKALGSSGDCNVDVNCPIGSDWETYKESNKKAVGILLTNGSGFCSGTLLNNTANDLKPYFLTANHCYSNPSTWAFRFEWISPTPSCATTASSPNGPTNKTISGATLRAKNANSDFCLVEINSAIPTAWDLTWAGWDNSDANPNFVVGIHHPSGDIMKICRDDSGPIQAVNSGAETWEITSAGNGWEIGVTEPGSSGSGLFDQNGRVIGQLFGGGAACAGTTDNNALDYFGRFGVSWNGASSSERLKDWLDPSNTNVSILNPLPPFVTVALDASVSIEFSDCNLAQLGAFVKLANYGSDNLTSATITWSVNGGSNNVINWTGNLTQGQTADINLGVLNSTTGNYVVNASVSNPNNGIDENTSNDATSKSKTLNRFETTQIHLDLLTDDYAAETSWELRNSAGTVLFNGNNYSSNNTHVIEDMSVPANDCYEFEIFDSSNDGVCCGYGNGSYKLTTDNNVIIKQGGSFSTSELTSFATKDGALSITDMEGTNIAVYPIPVQNQLTIEINNGVRYQYSLINSISQVMLQGSFEKLTTINVSNLASGVYFLKLDDDTKSIIKKIIIE